jgi:DNA-binding Lrp family transcriptional regulator
MTLDQKIIRLLLNLSVSEVITQRDIAKKLNVSYSTINIHLNKLVDKRLIYKVQFGRRRSTKYLVDTRLLVPSHIAFRRKSYFYSQFKSNPFRYKLDPSIKKVNIERLKHDSCIIDLVYTCISYYKRQVLEKKYLTNFDMLNDKLNLTEKENDLLRNYDNKIVRNNRLYFVIGGENYTFRQAVSYLRGKCYKKGKSLRLCGNPRKLISWRNEITGNMNFNCDFSKSRRLPSSEADFVSVYRSIFSGTQLDNISDYEIIHLYLNFMPMEILSKALYINKNIKHKIRSVHKYLYKSILNIRQDASNLDSEDFINVGFDDSDNVFFYPKLKEFYVIYNNMRADNVFHLFEQSMISLVGDKMCDSNINQMCLYFGGEPNNKLDKTFSLEGY